MVLFLVEFVTQFFAVTQMLAIIQIHVIFRHLTITHVRANMQILRVIDGLVMIQVLTAAL